MSGKHYGAIQVRHEADEDTEEESLSSSSSEHIFPLLSSVVVTPNKKVNVAVQTDPSTLSKVHRYLQQLWSDTTFNWLSPLLQTGNANGQLNIEDLETLPLPAECETIHVYAAFLKCWTDELNKAQEYNMDCVNNNDLFYNDNSAASRLLLHPQPINHHLFEHSQKPLGLNFSVRVYSN